MRDRYLSHWSNVTVAVLGAILLLVVQSSHAGNKRRGLSISTISPSAGQTLTGRMPWRVSASGQVDHVDFFVDGTRKWTERYSPYDFNGDGGTLDTTALSTGQHSLAATVYDTSGRSTSTSITVTVANTTAAPAATNTTAVPTVAISQPANGQTLSGKVRWVASVTGPQPSKVTFSIDGSVKWTERYAPYVFNGDENGLLDTTALSDGPHTLSVVAYAVTGNTAVASASVTVANDVPPATAFRISSSIVDGSALTGSLTWTAIPHGTSVTRVDFLVDGVSRWTEHYPPYQFNGDSGQLDTTTLSDGPHTFAVVAYAANGDRTSAQSSATVANQAPAGASTARIASGSVVFNGTFRDGTISQWEATSWGGAQCSNYGVASDANVARGTLSVVPDAVVSGSYTGRFDLPAAGTRTACELLRGRTIAMDDEWYSMEVRFPSDWKEPSPAGWGMSLAQLNFEDIWGTPLGVAAHGNSVSLTLNSGLCQRDTLCQYSSGIQGNVPGQDIIPASSFATGVWHQLLIHVKWTNGNDGVVEGFHRLRGETNWIRTVSYSGYPTLQRTSTFTPTAAERTVDKIGAYRGAASFPLTVWQDSFCQATSMAAAESCFGA